MAADLRELRLWHYRRAISARTLEAAHRANAEAWENEFKDRGVARWHRSQMRNAARHADFEEAAVRAMNAVVSGPVELDDEAYPKVKQQRRPKP